jgi:L,D-transpeptidase YcbB
VVTVPAFRLLAFESVADERPALQMAVVVGRAGRNQTPVFMAELRYLIFRPFWYPTRRIVHTEILPALERDASYLQREWMELVEATDDASPGLLEPPENLALLRAGRLWVRQRAGPHNALGLLKFVFPNDYDIYMHGTPARASFARARRDSSHGCIRLEQPAALAEFVLGGDAGWTRALIEAAMQGPTRRVEVSPPVPVLILYTTTIVRADGTVEFFEDIYGLDAKAGVGPEREPGP